MYMFDHHVHDVNKLIYRMLRCFLPHHVHVCAKFQKKIALVISTLQK